MSEACEGKGALCRICEWLDPLFLHPVAYESALRSVVSNLVPAVIIALVISVLAWRNDLLKLEISFGRLFSLVFVMGFFGALVGYAGGNSRSGVVGDVIPAVITFLAGGVAYFFGTSKVEPRPAALPMIASFLIAVFFSYALGSANRDGTERGKFRKETCLKIFADPKILADNAAFERAVALFDVQCAQVVNPGHENDAD